jgi:hypothetical protein
MIYVLKATKGNRKACMTSLYLFSELVEMNYLISPTNLPGLGTITQLHPHPKAHIYIRLVYICSQLNLEDFNFSEFSDFFLFSDYFTFFAPLERPLASWTL